MTQTKHTSKQHATPATGGRTRVLHLIDDLSPGGAQRSLLNLVSALDPGRFEVHVASLELRPLGALVEPFRAAGAQVHLLGPAGRSWMLAPFRVRALNAGLEPEIVHTHLAAAGNAGRMSARGGRAPYVVSTLYAVACERSTNPLLALDRGTLRLADRICAVSDAVREAVGRTAPELSERTITLRSGVPLEAFRADPASRDLARARLGFAPADLVVATTSRLEPGKGIETLLEAAAIASARAPMLQLLIVGDGPERHRLESLASERHISSWTTFTGSRSDVARLLAAADLFAVPSRTEGLGLAAIEALAAGLPVLASSVGGLPEIVEDGVCGRLLPPDSVAEWGDAIAAAANAPDGLAAWREAALERARKFSIEHSVSALSRLYASLTEGDSRERMAA